jgi:hypothetical protein
MSRLRSTAYESDIGEPGIVYEFEIKLQKIFHVDMTNAELEMESQNSIEDFERMLKARYKWITQIHQTGRSGGWLAIKDGKGGATKSKLKTIGKLVDKAQEDFVKYLQRTYPDR